MRRFLAIFISIATLLTSQLLDGGMLDIPEMSTHSEEILRLEQEGAEYQSSVYYLDIVSEIERMGDYIINISEALQNK